MAALVRVSQHTTSQTASSPLTNSRIPQKSKWTRNTTTVRRYPHPLPPSDDATRINWYQPQPLNPQTYPPTTPRPPLHLPGHYCYTCIIFLKPNDRNKKLRNTRRTRKRREQGTNTRHTYIHGRKNPARLAAQCHEHNTTQKTPIDRCELHGGENTNANGGVYWFLRINESMLPPT